MAENIRKDEFYSELIKIVNDYESERAGRWIGTSKCGGECGIHTKILK